MITLDPAILVAVAQLVVAGGAGWLILAGMVAVSRPSAARRYIAAMGSTPRIHWIEHGVRALVGAALIVSADASRGPELFRWGGIFLVATSLLIVVAPREWHQRYSRNASDMLGNGAIRALGPFSIAAGAALLWALSG